MSLELDLEYDFRVKSFCGDLSSAYTPVYRTFVNCGTCFAEYCDFPLLNDGITYVEYFRLDDFENSSFNTGTGYEDYRGENDLVLAPNQESEIELSINEFSFNSGNNATIAIDFNRNLDFEMEEIIYSGEILINEPLIFTFTVPNDIDFGISRIRVIVSSFGYQEFVTCEENNDAFWGEVEEYCVLLGEKPSLCDLDFNVELTNIQAGSANFTWEKLLEATAYNFRYKKTNESEWEYLATVEPSAELNDLEDCTEYEFEVRGVCPFDTSSYKNRIVFTSFCPTATIESDLSINNISAYPNPWVTNFTIKLESSKSDEVSISLVGLDGSKKSLISNSKIQTGLNEISIENVDNILSGVYFIEIINSDNKQWLYKTIKMQ